MWQMVEAWKDKKGKTALNVFIKILNECNRKPNISWVDQRREFSNRFMQKWLGNTDISIYFRYNEGNSVITEMFIKTLKGKTCKRMTANVIKSYLSYFNKLVDQYNNTYHQSIGK